MGLGKRIVLNEQITVQPYSPNYRFLSTTMGAKHPWAFKFLHCEKQFPANRIDWQSSDMPRLWRYNLHYFDYLQDISLTEEHKFFIIGNWIEKNPLGTETAWEPYTTSLRIVNWVKYFLTKDRQKIPDSWVRSLALQSHWLYHNLELHILANHLFKNIKALLFSSLYLKGKAPVDWFSCAERLLVKQVAEQILDDGGHFERSPMYHSIFLEDLLDLLNFNPRNQYSGNTLNLMRDSASKSAVFLRDILMSDGKIPLFNDSAFGIAPAPEVLLDYSQRILKLRHKDKNIFPPQTSFKSSGYFILGTETMRMLIDCGETGPRYQPGHTHCDTLSYELSIAEKRLVVDTGTYDYEPGTRRRYDRSTAAHNTIMVDEHEQSEVWGLFRVARRASPISANLAIDNEGNQYFQGSHNGYRRLSPKVTHHREVVFEPQRGWKVTDLLEGKGKHRIESFIHIHPDVQIEECNNQLQLLDCDGQFIASININNDHAYDISNSVYHPEFGKEVDNKVIRLYFHGLLPVTLSYDINIV